MLWVERLYRDIRHRRVVDLLKRGHKFYHFDTDSSFDGNPIFRTDTGEGFSQVELLHAVLDAQNSLAKEYKTLVVRSSRDASAKCNTYEYSINQTI